MKRKFIFLDIDGVLVNNESLRRRTRSEVAKADPSCIAALNHIIRQTGALIVVSSTWRAHGFNRLSRIFESWGVAAPIFGFTPDLSQRRDVLYTAVERGDEIQKWIDNHADLIGQFVILDDSSDMNHLLPSLVKTDSDIGLTMQDAEKAIAILKSRGQE